MFISSGKSTLFGPVFRRMTHICVFSCSVCVYINLYLYETIIIVVLYLISIALFPTKKLAHIVCMYVHAMCVCVCVCVCVWLHRVYICPDKRMFCLFFPVQWLVFSFTVTYSFWLAHPARRYLLTGASCQEDVKYSGRCSSITHRKTGPLRKMYHLFCQTWYLKSSWPCWNSSILTVSHCPQKLWVIIKQNILNNYSA